MNCEAVPNFPNLGSITLTDPDVTTYALNGTAKAQTDYQEFTNETEIWADDPGSLSGKSKIGIGLVIRFGQELCE